MPKVSVVMCIYNGEKYLRESIESILNQTFTDFEFIIINDGSTDSTQDILDKFWIKYKRITLIYRGKNIGIAKSLNTGLSIAEGEYIARQDADDISLPRRLEMQVDYMDSHPDVALVGTGVEVIDKGGRVLRTHQFPTDHESMKAELLIGNHAICHSATMIRAEAFGDL